MMLKKNKKFFIASCIVILLPMFAGFLLWDQLQIGRASCRERV